MPFPSFDRILKIPSRGFQSRCGQNGRQFSEGDSYRGRENSYTPLGLTWACERRAASGGTVTSQSMSAMAIFQQLPLSFTSALPERCQEQRPIAAQK